jgi:hypothetical protein
MSVEIPLVLWVRFLLSQMQCKWAALTPFVDTLELLAFQCELAMFERERNSSFVERDDFSAFVVSLTNKSQGAVISVSEGDYSLCLV